MNGLWKSIRVEQWKADFRTAPLDASNYLYFPLTAALCRVLDVLRIHADQTWRQLALINAAFAGIAVAIVFWMVRRLTSRRDVAAIAALVHLGSAFFLSLAVSNEDIMPSYTFILASMAMAAVWFAAPAARQVVCVAALFTVGWLMEWRLMFPTLPPLLLALALSRGPLLVRAGRIVLFLAVMIGVALIVVTIFRGHPGAVGLPGVLWTGKGVGSGWSGFSLDKLGLVIEGMGEYLLGGHNAPSADFHSATAREWGGAFVVEMILLAAAALLLWRRRHDAVVHTVAVVFLGTLAAGEFMNAYAQPSDPQMQINVMPWLSVAVALLVAELLASIRLRQAVTPLAIFCAFLPLAYNVATFGATRGLDGRMEGASHTLERLTDPARTVFVYTGFESIVAWQFLAWSHDWEGVCGLGPAPQPVPKFKWIGLFGPIVRHPAMTNAEYEAGLRMELDCAFDKGYRVVVGGLVWQKSARDLADWMTELNARSRAATLYAVLHDGYRATPLAEPVFDGSPVLYQEITRR